MASIIRRPLNLTVAVLFRLTPLLPFFEISSSVNSNPTRCSELIKVPSLVEGGDYKHWLVLMKPPKRYPPRNNIVQGFVKTLAMALGSEEEAKRSIYSVSTKYYYAFGCRVHEPLTYKIRCIDTDRSFRISFSSVVDYFIHLKDPTKGFDDGLAYILENGIYELNTVADDGSLEEVTGVGINTEWGLLMASISEDTGEETPLQVRLNGLATFIGIVGLTVAVVVLVALLVRYFTGTTQDSNGATQFVKGKTSISDTVDDCVKIFTIAVTIVVVAVLPYGVRSTLGQKEATSLRRLGKVLPPHFALGRSRQLQGLATAMVKLWEKSVIAKVALKRGVQLTTSERMAEDNKRLTGPDDVDLTEDGPDDVEGLDVTAAHIANLLSNEPADS